MKHDEPRNYITIEDGDGKKKEYAVEALFDMEDESYALLKSLDETIVMRIEEEEDNQFLVEIDDPHESAAVLDAYQIAFKNAPAE